jgi:hypothetical protein
MIMRDLAERDPSAALALAATSRRQTSLAEALRGILARQSLLGGSCTATATDYLRASLALGGVRHSHHTTADVYGRSGGVPLRAASARNTEIAGVVMCLLEAYARFLLADPDSADERVLGPGEEADHNGSDLVARVAARLGQHSPLARVAAWYEWTVAPYRDPFSRHAPGVVAWLIETDPIASGGDGHFDRDLVDQHRRLLDDPQRSIAIGPVGGDLIDDPIKIQQLTTLFVFRGESGARRLSRLLSNVVSPGDLLSWWSGYIDGGGIRAAIRSPDAYWGLLRGIDRGVRLRLRGRCGDPANSGRLALPAFTSLFEVSAPHIVAAPDALVLMANVWSPGVEALFGA